MGTSLRVETRPTHDKYQKYNRSSKGNSRRGTHNDKRRADSEARYLSREIVAWDGEGLNETDGSHTYVLLASSTGARITSREGVGTAQALELFLQQPKTPIHVGYGLSYDVNMLLKDLTRHELEALYRQGWLRWGGYFIQWRRGKSFSVSRGRQSFLLYDVLPFFQRPFVAACDEYLGEDWFMRDTIIQEKKNRGQFTYEEIVGITEYNDAELVNLVRLVSELRSRLHKVGIRIKRWDGPGAVAAAIYTKQQTKSHFGATPDEVTESVRHGYAGGRFEILRKGHSDYSVYQYDIRSAYPSAMRFLPCLAHGEWKWTGPTTSIVPYGIYRVEVTDPVMHSSQPQPLWQRNKNGTVYFAEYAHGWYWSPEVQNAIELGGVTVHEGWEWIPACEHKPFDFIEGMYNKRAALKKAGDGAQVALKLGLNSLYGKLAQQIGWSPGPPLKLPPYHSLEWAGFITSHCRAQIFRAALMAPDDVIAFETDAIFSRVQLDLPVGEALGQWDYTEYRNLTYLKSGMYWGEEVSGKYVEKCRGINKGSITRQDVIHALEAEKRGEHVTLPAEQTRFITAGQALHQDFSKWRRWVTAPRDISVALNGKRIDLITGSVYAEKHDGFRETQEGIHDTEFSYQYPIAWADQEHKEHMASPDGLDFEMARQMQIEEMGFAYDGQA